MAVKYYPGGFHHPSGDSMMTLEHGIIHCTLIEPHDGVKFGMSGLNSD